MLGSANTKMRPAESWLHPSPRLSTMRRAELGAVCAAAALLVVVAALVVAASGGHPAVPAAIGLGVLAAAG
ncbi:MAG TPA: hypothetical protein VGR61_07040, partial [Candidatus Dormibacteraeota bacterium]|nr:hypothetical protein [Candidatus Dormibacteraeota bacterium]